MIDKLIKYYDEETIEELYCIVNNCNECMGTDYNGEPNGYGCDAQEDYHGDEYNQIMDDYKIPYYKCSDVETKFEELEQQNKEYREILAKIVKVFPMGFTHIEYKDKALELLSK